jgi:hypothetical protein
MTTTVYEWDVFISYAREDSLWVQTQLFEPLQRWRTETGGPVRAFVDVESLKAGANWMRATATTIAASRTVVGVYSAAFFNSENCQFEWSHAVGRDPMGARGLVFPIMIEDVADAIPPEYTQLHSVDTRRSGWFDRIVERLKLKQAGHVQELRFVSPLTDVNVNQTLSEVQVSAAVEGTALGAPEMVTLFSEQGGLRGTLSTKCQDGVAVFTDLFVGVPLNSTRLVATAPGCAAGFSNAFAVIAERPVAVLSGDPLIPAQGEAIFFELPETIAVINTEAIGVFDLAGRQLGRHPVNGLRLRHCGVSGLLLGTWSGEILWAAPDGRIEHWNLPSRDGFGVIGDVCEDATAPDVFYAACWSGEVYRLGRGGVVDLVLHHLNGVQALCWSEDRLVVCDLEGSLCVYRDGQIEAQYPIDRVVRLAKPYFGCVVIVGQHHLYQYSFGRDEPYAQSCRFELRAVYGDGHRCIAIGPDGRGVIFGCDLSLQPFRGMPGAAPTSAGWDATSCVLRNPDKTHTLLDRGLMAYQHAGPLAISPDSSCFAVSSERGFRIISADAFLQQARRAV